jgi:uncharacterized repeat protein (TIGR04052 family)
MQRLFPPIVPIIVLIVVGCAPEHYPVDIGFEVRLHGEPISCAAGINGVRLTDLRFYVSEVRLRDTEGEWQALTMAVDDTWQLDGVALIDLEDGQGACLNGTSAMNALLRGSLPAAPGTGLVFTIGVPRSLNHMNPLSAAAPLSYTIMHWHWASGYKFIRAGVETEDDGYFLHLGSNRCEGTIGDIKGCIGDNRPVVELDQFRPYSNTVVVLDIGVLFAGVDLEDGTDGRCMSGPSNPQCEPPFRALGIDFPSGTSVSSPPAISLELNR